tara:strand:+ start:1789 stop:2136 length:348 start_codon:yes stop_codon:yes gene_type:complete
MNTVEALEEQDCMCIGLSVTRPEAAIADSSRLIIRDIFPTYISADSFLESAQFKISNSAGAGAAAHGGFDESSRRGCPSCLGGRGGRRGRRGPRGGYRGCCCGGRPAPAQEKEQA